MQNKNVAKNDMEKTGRVPTRTMTIGDVVLPAGPKRQVSKLNQVKLEGHEGAKRTSVAVLKYKPGLAKAQQADKRKSSNKKTFGKDNVEPQLWSTVAGGTEVHFSGYAIRHLKPHSQSPPGKISVARSSSDTSYPQNQIDQIKAIHQQNLPPRQTLSPPSPQPWTEPKKADHNSALLDNFSDTALTLFGYPKATHAALLFSHAGGSLRISDKFSPDGKRYTIPSVHIEKPWSHYRPLITNASKDWSRFVSECGEFVLPKRDHKDLHYSGYAVRYLKPNVLQSWKYSHQTEPSFSNYNQKPIAFDTLCCSSLQPWY